MKIKKGETIVFEHDEYSDYGIFGVHVALYDVDLMELKNSFLSDFVGVQPDYYRFLQWLIDNRYFADVDCRNIHLGSYGDLSITEN